MHEVFADGAGGVRGEILLARRRLGVGDHHRGMGQRLVLAQHLQDFRDTGLALADGGVDAANAGAALGQDGVQRDGGLAGGAVAEDQLALAAAQRQQGVDDLGAGVQRLADGLSFDHARRLALHRPGYRGARRRSAVERPAESVDDATQQFLADRHAGDPAGRPQLIPGRDVLRGIEEDDAHVMPAQVERQGRQAVGAFQQLAVADRGHAAHRGDAVADARDPADLAVAHVPVNIGQRLAYEATQLLDAVAHESFSSSPTGPGVSSCPARDASQTWPPSRSRTPPSKAGTVDVARVTGWPTSSLAVSVIRRTVASSSSPAVSSTAPSSGCH